MELYAKYIRERENSELITFGDYAFFTYKVLEDYLYIVDVYVVPEKRKKGIAKMILNMGKILARQHGKNKILGSVSKGIESTEDSKAFLSALGFNNFKENEDIIYLVYEGDL